MLETDLPTVDKLAKRRAYMRDYYAKNHDKFIARAEERRDVLRERARKYRAENLTLLRVRDELRAIENPDRHKNWYYADVERARERSRKSKIKQRMADPERAISLAREYRQEHREKLRVNERARRLADLERYREYGRKRLSTPYGLINNRIRRLVRFSLDKCGLKKSCSTAKLIGWTIDELIERLESLFEIDMNWHNKHLWQIDHIIPLVSFNFETVDDPEFKKAWALSNLAPLWKEDNAVKHDRRDWLLPSHYINPLMRSAYDKPS